MLALQVYHAAQLSRSGLRGEGVMGSGAGDVNGDLEKGRREASLEQLLKLRWRLYAVGAAAASGGGGGRSTSSTSVIHRSPGLTAAIAEPPRDACTRVSAEPSGRVTSMLCIPR
mmetsp:Transcript_2864/g.8894  ORF Transcript_2864/g.8894 Transcript_2864/m.8894 type:complete len:114 (-) Transcript_2864:225-566(-)